MLYNEFVEHLQTNAQLSLDIFLEKATEYQNEKNKNRKVKEKWPEEKIQIAVNKMYNQLLTNTYETIKIAKPIPKYNRYQIWEEFLLETEFLEMFADSIAQMEFE
ncbi:hypothetical protein [Enterococcus faecalis]|uniref:hypothetical protein n=1 Tax=Enterococcus faecalis TaxID=1351 RepID=UPI003D108012